MGPPTEFPTKSTQKLKLYYQLCKETFEQHCEKQKLSNASKDEGIKTSAIDIINTDIEKEAVNTDTEKKSIDTDTTEEGIFAEEGIFEMEIEDMQ